jgi:uncharacterized RDD family membrane protein YckC
VDHLTIETPEQVPLEFLLAGIGSRFLALALDTAIQVLAGALVALAGAVIGAGVGMIGSPQGETWAVAALVLATFLVQFAYFAFFEVFWNGQTPGKRYLHLRVIKDSGRPITAYDAISRNLLRIVDSLPGIYAVGIVSALLSSKSKRLGDYVAGTVVVHERPLLQTEISWSAKPEKRAPASPAPSVLNLGPGPLTLEETTREISSTYDVTRLSPEEFQLMEAFLLRRDQLAFDVRTSMARRIAERIAPKLEVSEADQRRPERLLETLVAEYRNRARFR